MRVLEKSLSESEIARWQEISECLRDRLYRDGRIGGMQYSLMGQLIDEGGTMMRKGQI